jgi:hypothetical protein
MSEFHEFSNSEARIESLDMSSAWDTESQKDLVIERLKELGLYKPDLLYRGFDGEKVKAVLEYGTDKKGENQIWGSAEEDLADSQARRQSAIKFAMYQDVPGLAVYDRSKLIDGDEEYSYAAAPGRSIKDALIIVFEMTNI